MIFVLVFCLAYCKCHKNKTKEENNYDKNKKNGNYDDGGFRSYAADGCTDSGCFKTKPPKVTLKVGQSRLLELRLPEKLNGLQAIRPS